MLTRDEVIYRVYLQAFAATGSACESVIADLCREADEQPREDVPSDVANAALALGVHDGGGGLRFDHGPNEPEPPRGPYLRTRRAVLEQIGRLTGYELVEPLRDNDGRTPGAAAPGATSGVQTHTPGVQTDAPAPPRALKSVPLEPPPDAPELGKQEVLAGPPHVCGVDPNDQCPKCSRPGEYPDAD